MGESQTPSPASDTSRTVADRFRVVRVLGAGQARTLLCEDSATEQEVVLKVLALGDAEDWQQVELFRGEIKTLGGLRHDGIPRVLECIEDVDTAGRPALILVQERIAGRTLLEHIDAGPRLGSDEALELARSLLDILAYLHTRLPPVIHRDIKPANIIVRPDGRPVLVDFGVVRSTWPRADPGAEATLVGTVGYMPPEQYLGRVDPRSDLFALGASLLHLVTGVAPAEQDVESGRLEVPAELPLDTPLRGLIDALLEPAPRDRPSSAAVARAILEQRTGLAKLPPRRRAAAIVPQTPQLLDLGGPPRSLKGPFADVYRNMVPSFFTVHRMGKCAPPTSVGDVLFTLLFVLPVTLGLFPIIALIVCLGRRRSRGPLFEDGVFTVGRVVATAEHVGGPWNSQVVYEFEAGDGETYRAATTYGSEVVRYWEGGSEVGILYDPTNPTVSTIAFR